ncbi:MAG: hypothetical protein JNM27_17080 [Leptospirales bacterium]|nr:hypothetical protein [Leptospirales bacterium]
MKKPDLTDLTFDEEDLKLFNITSNLHLKAQAIRYSIVPKLGVLLEAALSQVYAVYGIAVFDEHSFKTSSPNYRRETTATTMDYDSAFVGIGGARGPIWNGLVLSNGKPIKIIPYRLGFELSDEGLKLFFDHRPGKLLATKSIRKYFSFFRGNWSKIQTIMSHSDMILDFNFDSVQ